MQEKDNGTVGKYAVPCEIGKEHGFRLLNISRRCSILNSVTMEVKSNLWMFVLLAVMLLSSFVVMATDGQDSKNPAVKESNENGGDDAVNREKRSREEIMFGNQQNKPSGLVDDIMALPDRSEDGDSQAATAEDTAKNTTDTQDNDQQKLEEAFKDDEKADKRKDDLDQYAGDDLGEENSYNWYTNPQTPPQTLQYLLSPQLDDMPSDADEEGDGLYDQEVYRRKRQLLGHPLPLRKRSLRSPLGQMVSRGRRLPRRSMRLKRQVDVEDLLSLLGNIENNNPRYFDDQGQNNQQIPDISPSEFRYPYSFVRHDDEDDEDGDDEPDVLSGSRFLDGEFSVPYRGRADSEAPSIPEWMVRHPTHVFSVSRRSVPGFYPLDYRFMPAAYRKRSPRARWLPGNSNTIAADDEETDFGKWGRIVQVPEAYASAEDVARLYALANLMADSDEGQSRMRRSL